ncbi:MAG: endolytic transglycosylase MltG [Calditrichia bacterium]|nr:endolytic transglycosylase MltG [Calditrichia bacterium]
MKVVNLFKNLNGRQKSIIILLLILPFFICDLINYCTIPDLNGDLINTVTVEIPKGSTLQTIADTLKNKGLIEDIELFKIWIMSLGKEKEIKAGHFEIPVGLNYAQLAKYLSQAKVKQIKVTLLEGWSNEDIALKLQDELGINKKVFIKLTEDSVFISQFGINKYSLEGYLLPDTYYFYWGMSEKTIIEILFNSCLSKFDSTARIQMDKLKMNQHQILTLASIIEGEAILDDERSKIASVYYNRLNRNIKLQADPTIQYILQGPPRRLLYKDLEIDSPYNTYKYYGLPPGPINNPGKSSINAAIYPEITNFIFFVATGDGGHAFSKNAAEHARAKAKFNRIRREVRKRKKIEN